MPLAVLEGRGKYFIVVERVNGDRLPPCIAVTGTEYRVHPARLLTHIPTRLPPGPVRYGYREINVKRLLCLPTYNKNQVILLHDQKTYSRRISCCHYIGKG